MYITIYTIFYLFGTNIGQEFGLSSFQKFWFWINPNIPKIPGVET